MKNLIEYISEKLVISKDIVTLKVIKPKNFKALRQIVEQRYNELGPGTEQYPIDFNDIDVSGIKSLGFGYRRGIFKRTHFEYIDISKWNITKIYESTFYDCKELKNVNLPPTITCIDNSAFCNCKKLISIYINKNITYIDYNAFERCESLKTVYVDDIYAFNKIKYGNSVARPTFYGATVEII